jgi:DNA-binding response OmpR family regulator
MIVDDNKKRLGELEEILSFSGYNMIVALDSYSVLPIAAREKPHVILLNLKMPGKSGFQLVHELKSSPELQKIPIIAMIEFFNDDYKTFMDMFDIKRCLKKPFNPLDVIMGIKAVLE